MKALDTGPKYYKNFKIEPIEFILANKLGFLEGNVVKYICRYRDKGGVEDLRKAQHYLQFLLEVECDLPGRPNLTPVADRLDDSPPF